MRIFCCAGAAAAAAAAAARAWRRAGAALGAAGARGRAARAREKGRRAAGCTAARRLLLVAETACMATLLATAHAIMPVKCVTGEPGGMGEAGRRWRDGSRMGRPARRACPCLCGAPVSLALRVHGLSRRRCMYIAIQQVYRRSLGLPTTCCRAQRPCYAAACAHGPMTVVGYCLARTRAQLASGQAAAAAVRPQGCGRQAFGCRMRCAGSRCPVEGAPSVQLQVGIAASCTVRTGAVPRCACGGPVPSSWDLDGSAVSGLHTRAATLAPLHAPARTASGQQRGSRWVWGVAPPPSSSVGRLCASFGLPTWPRLPESQPAGAAPTGGWAAGPSGCHPIASALLWAVDRPGGPARRLVKRQLGRLHETPACPGIRSPRLRPAAAIAAPQRHQAHAHPSTSSGTGRRPVQREWQLFPPVRAAGGAAGSPAAVQQWCPPSTSPPAPSWSPATRRRCGAPTEAVDHRLWRGWPAQPPPGRAAARSEAARRGARAPFKRGGTWRRVGLEQAAAAASGATAQLGAVGACWPACW